MAGSLNPTAAALSALAAVDFQHTRELRSIWRDPPDDVAALNGQVVQMISDELVARAPPGEADNPLGRVVIGQAGAGKTHLLGALRRAVWRRGGWFVLLDLLDTGDFWATAALSYVDALGRKMPDQSTQGEAMLARLLPRQSVLGRLIGRLAPGGPAVRRGAWRHDAVVLLAGLREQDRAGAQAHRDVVQAVVALLGADPAAQDLAHAWLQGQDIGTSGQAKLGVLSPIIAARRAVQGMSWLMAFAGPTLLAVDQIDAIIGIANADRGGTDGQVQRRVNLVLDDVAGGMMALRDTLHRTMTLLSSLEATWEILTTRAVRSFAGRFHAPIRLSTLSSATLAQHLVEARLARTANGFARPYPSWPFRTAAFATAIDFTPRQLLEACEAHRSACLRRGEVSELSSFASGAAAPPAPPGLLPESADGDLDTLYDQLRAAAGSIGTDGEEALTALLRAALAVLQREIEPPGGRQLLLETDLAGLHARLRLIDAGSGRERHFCFCVVPQSSARAVQARLQSAFTASGIASRLPFRSLFIVRNDPWPSGAVTQERVAELLSFGGQVLAIGIEDLRSFIALQQMMERCPAGFDAWVRQRRPLAGSRFVLAIGLLPALAGDLAAITTAEPDLRSPIRKAAIAPDAAIPLGVRAGDRAEVRLPLNMLPRHVAVIAGSGSGKTVLLRRLVEEAALATVPSIVLDSNNDLVRLGLPWPERPAGFTEVDTVKAARFADDVEVVVWTPGRSRGNPLSLAPLPDFAAVCHDPDECEVAVGMAAASLMGLIPSGGQARLLRQGVLMDALRFFAAGGGGGLDALIELMRDLPVEATEIDKAAKLAAEVANALVAARARNPLLESAGALSDPSALLAGTRGRTRVSVVSLAGLPSDEARQDFVARLLMALFSHIRRHPAGPERPVTGLLVMDEAQNFAPSGQATSSRLATLALVRQARKYGLGMLFATQMPRSIDTGIIGNCTTQLFGRLNAPAALDTVREVLANRGGAPDDLGRLSPGQFYLTTEGAERPQKLQAPLCLTYHAANPPSEDEVVAIAGGAGRRPT